MCGCTAYNSQPAFEDGTDKVFRNVGIQQSDAGEIPKRLHTIGITKIKHGFYMKRYEILQDLTRTTIRNATLSLHFRSQFIPAVIRFCVQ